MAAAALVPVTFVPVATDSFILPRTALVLTFGFAGLGLLGAVEPGLRRPLLAIAAAAALATVFSVNPWLSLAGAYTRYESLPVRLAYAGLLVLGVVAGRDRGARRWSAMALVLSACACSLEAILQAAWHTLARPDGNLGQANLLGGLIALAFPLCVRLGLARSPWLLGLPLLGSGLVLSASRSGWLGALFGLLVMAAFLAPIRRRRLMLAAGAGVLAAALAALVASPLRFLNGDTGSARLGVWGDGARMLLARPLTGWGPDTTGLVFGRFQTADWEPGDTFDRIHSAVLDLGVTQGALGLLALTWLVVILVRRFAGARVDVAAAGWIGCCAAYVPWALLNFDWAPVTGLAWLAAGLAWAEVSRPLLREPRPIGPAGAGAAVAAGLVGIVLGCLPLAADIAGFRGEPALAARIAPWQGQYHRLHGERLGPSRAGVAELEAAERLGVYDYAFYLELGDAEKTIGRPDRARAAYERAIVGYRFSPLARERLRQLGG